MSFAIVNNMLTCSIEATNLGIPMSQSDNNLE